jgi:hypothetical protein
VRVRSAPGLHADAGHVPDGPGLIQDSVGDKEQLHVVVPERIGEQLDEGHAGAHAANEHDLAGALHAQRRDLSFKSL